MGSVDNGRPIVSLTPLLKNSDWRGPPPAQIRELSKVFAILRGTASVAVLGLAGPLFQSSWRPGVVFLILFVSTYNGLALFGFYRLADGAVLNLARAVGVIDVLSFFIMLWTFGPFPPGAMVACFVAVLNVAVAFDGIFGAGVFSLLFAAGYGGLGAIHTFVLRTPFPISDFVLWCAVIVIIAVSLTIIQRVLVAMSVQIGDPTPRHALLPAATFHISPRELEVLQLVAEGYSNTMIANRLHLSDNTVKGYVETVLTRLNARNRAEAVAAASRMKLL
jgi:DNA-binding CsgD family transcriptional regulator